MRWAWAEREINVSVFMVKTEYPRSWKMWRQLVWGPSLCDFSWVSHCQANDGLLQWNIFSNSYVKPQFMPGAHQNVWVVTHYSEFTKSDRVLLQNYVRDCHVITNELSLIFVTLVCSYSRVLRATHTFLYVVCHAHLLVYCVSRTPFGILRVTHSFWYIACHARLLVYCVSRTTFGILRVTPSGISHVTHTFW